MEFSGETTVNKLILLFVFDKMDIPITENTIIEMCTSRNMWLTYLDCIQAITELLETQFIYESICDGNKYYSITPLGDQFLEQLKVSWAEINLTVNHLLANNLQSNEQ